MHFRENVFAILAVLTAAAIATVPGPSGGHVAALSPLGSEQLVPRSSPASRVFTFNNRDLIETDTTSFHAQSKDGTFKLDVDGNLGTFFLKGRLFQIAIFNVGNFDDGPGNPRLYEFPFFGYDSKGLVYGFAHAHGSESLYIASAYGTGGEFDICADMVNNKPTTRVDKQIVTSFNITGTFTVVADKKECPTFKGPDSHLDKDCTGRFMDYDLVVFAQFDQTDDGLLEMFVVASNGKYSCLGEFFLSTKSVLVLTLFTECFGFEYPGTPTYPEFNAAKAKSLGDGKLPYNLPGWWYDNHNITRPS